MCRELHLPALLLNAAYLMAWLLALLGGGQAERLPVRQYTVADGLAQGTVGAIYQDAQGFLWLATGDGLSRFDGYRFTNYGIKDGLTNSRINDVVADRRGRLWVATNGGGVALLLDEVEAARRGRKFLNFLIRPDSDSEYANRVNRILFDADNRLWCATDWGLFRAKSLEVATEQFEPVKPPVPSVPSFYDLCLDQHGRIWSALDDELLRIEGRHITSYRLWQEVGATTNDREHHFIKGIAKLADGRLLIATRKDLYEFIEPTSASERGTWRRLPLNLTSLQSIEVIHPAVGGGLWIGTTLGLIRYRDGQQVPYRIGNSPNPLLFRAFLTDRDGNLWIGTRQTGLLKLAGEAVVVYDASDGLLPVQEVYWLKETKDGRMMLEGRPVSPHSCNETYFTNDTVGRKASLDHFPSSPGLCVHGVVQDGHKNWWILRWLPERQTYRVRFIPGPKFNPSAGYELTAADGWVDDCCQAGLYKDSEGYVWFRNGAQQVFRAEYANNGRPFVREIIKSEETSHMIRAPSGTLWFSGGGVVSRHQNGKIETVRKYGEMGGQTVRVFFFDSRGRLWVGTEGQGIHMSEKPDAEAPTFVNYSTANGLAANYVEAMCEDDEGYIWLGTGRGLDRLDVPTGRVSHFPFGDNSIGSVIRDMHRDVRGNIWASVVGAVIRINPHLLPRTSPQLPVSLIRVRIAGELLPLAETGSKNVIAPELAAARNNVAIEFLSPNFRGENALQYQFKLEGADRDWSAPGNQREVNYANLSPGQYRFLARAIDDAGVVSTEPATLRFTILRPVWQRWWFVLLAVCGLGGTAFAFYRSRLKRVIELERVRARIATDLHDDIGSSLSQIAILSEVSRQRIGNQQNGISESLAQIANTSRDLVDTMSDIVWAINPKRDRLSDLSQRMHEFASEVFTARDIACRFHGTGDGHDLRLDADVRRQLYLICKEAVNNAARHSQCSAAEITFAIHDQQLVLVVQDNGLGFDSTGTGNGLRGGNGLDSMRQRARALGGELDIHSQPQYGTTVSLRLPFLTRSRARWRKYLPV